MHVINRPVLSAIFLDASLKVDSETGDQAKTSTGSGSPQHHDPSLTLITRHLKCVCRTGEGEEKKKVCTPVPDFHLIGQTRKSLSLRLSRLSVSCRECRGQKGAAFWFRSGACGGARVEVCEEPLAP